MNQTIDNYKKQMDWMFLYCEEAEIKLQRVQAAREMAKMHMYDIVFQEDCDEYAVDRMQAVINEQYFTEAVPILGGLWKAILTIINKIKEVLFGKKKEIQPEQEYETTYEKFEDKKVEQTLQKLNAQIQKLENAKSKEEVERIKKENEQIIGEGRRCWSPGKKGALAGVATVAGGVVLTGAAILGLVKLTESVTNRVKGVVEQGQSSYEKAREKNAPEAEVIEERCKASRDILDYLKDLGYVINDVNAASESKDDAKKDNKETSSTETTGKSTSSAGDGNRRLEEYRAKSKKDQRASTRAHIMQHYNYKSYDGEKVKDVSLFVPTDLLEKKPKKYEEYTKHMDKCKPDKIRELLKACGYPESDFAQIPSTSRSRYDSACADYQSFIAMSDAAAKRYLSGNVSAFHQIATISKLEKYFRNQSDKSFEGLFRLSEADWAGLNSGNPSDKYTIKFKKAGKTVSVGPDTKFKFSPGTLQRELKKILDIEMMPDPVVK